MSFLKKATTVMREVTKISADQVPVASTTAMDEAFGGDESSAESGYPSYWEALLSALASHLNVSIVG